MENVPKPPLDGIDLEAIDLYKKDAERLNPDLLFDNLDRSLELLCELERKQLIYSRWNISSLIEILSFYQYTLHPRCWTSLMGTIENMIEAKEIFFHSQIRTLWFLLQMKCRDCKYKLVNT